MRRKIKNRNIVQPDFIYNSQKLEKFINYIMWSGKKETARKMMYATFDIIKEKTGNPNPLEVFDFRDKEKRRYAQNGRSQQGLCSFRLVACFSI